MQSVGNTWNMTESNAPVQELVRWGVFEIKLGEFGESQKIAVGIGTGDNGVEGVVTAPILDYVLKTKTITVGDGDRYKFIGDEGLDDLGRGILELWATMHGVKQTDTAEITHNYV
jgi:hypothetical protein